MAASAQRLSWMNLRGPRAGRAIAWAMIVLVAAANALEHPGSNPVALTVQEIVAKNAAARGGLEAWHRVQTVVWSGHLESAHAPMPSLPFVLAKKRPNKTRFEIDAVRERTVRVFDGMQGWNVRPGPDGRPDARPFTPQELGFALRAAVIDGPLMAADARGDLVALEGIEQVDGRAAYRLVVRLPSGERDHVWIDARTFLDVRSDRSAPSTTAAPVTLFYRDYKAIDGLQMPTTIETSVNPRMPPDKLLIERIAVNPDLDDALFANPATPPHRARVTAGGGVVPTGAAAPSPARDAGSR